MVEAGPSGDKIRGELLCSSTSLIGSPRILTTGAATIYLLILIGWDREDRCIYLLAIWYSIAEEVSKDLQDKIIISRNNS